MAVWIVFQYQENFHAVIGVYDTYEKAKEKHSELPTWRYIRKHIVE